MTKSELAYQAKRVEAALRWAQKHLGTSFHFIVTPVVEAATKQDNPHTIMQITETPRGKDDPMAFQVWFFPDAVADATWKSLRSTAGHEALHALLWQATRRTPIEKEEAVVYQLQRIIFGEM